MLTYMKKYQTGIGIGIAAALWFFMFSPWTATLVNFWYAMTVSALILTLIATVFCREWLKDMKVNVKTVMCGLAIAFVLWWIFWTGDKVSQWLFGFARPQVDLIYGMKSDNSPMLIAALLLLVIGPAEEIFWRGFVQRRLMQQWSPNVGFFVTTACYILIHVWSFNFMLIMAAMVVGFCWGVIYRFFPRSLTALIISHAVWDACAFVFFPF